MSVKYFDKNKNKWVIFPGTVGAPGKNGKTGILRKYVNIPWYLGYICHDS